MYMDHIYDRLCKKAVVTDDGLFEAHKVALRLMQVEAAALQHNCSLALRLLKTTREVINCGVFCFQKLCQYLFNGPIFCKYRLSKAGELCALCFVGVITSEFNVVGSLAQRV